MKVLRLAAHLKAAAIYSELSHARRLKVGSVLVKDDRIISIGYNGTVSGSDNNCEDEVDGELVTKPEVVHAEMNCIAFAAKHGLSTNGCSLVTTHSPCYNCSLLMIQAGVKEIYYHKQYRDPAGIMFLRKNGVKVEKL